MRRGNGGRVRAKIGLWDEISLIAGWEEQKQLIVKNSGKSQCKKLFSTKTIHSICYVIEDQTMRESGGNGGAKIGLWDEIFECSFMI